MNRDIGVTVETSNALFTQVINIIVIIEVIVVDDGDGDGDGEEVLFQKGFLLLNFI